MTTAHHYTVSPVRTFIYWIVSLVPASGFLALLLLLRGGEGDVHVGLKVVYAVIAFAKLLFLSSLFALPVFGLLLLTGRAMNKRHLRIEQYLVFHNLLHLVAGLLWYRILDYLLNGFLGDYEIVFLGIVYTIAGVLTWSTVFLVSLARTHHTRL